MDFDMGEVDGAIENSNAGVEETSEELQSVSDSIAATLNDRLLNHLLQHWGTAAMEYRIPDTMPSFLSFLYLCSIFFFLIEHLITGIVNYETLRCRLGALTRACACFREFSTWTEIGLALCFPHIHSLSINLAVCLFVLVFLTLLPVRGQDTGKIFISWRRCNKDNGPIFHFFFPSLIQETPFVSWEVW